MSFRIKIKRGIAVALSAAIMLGSAGNIAVLQEVAFASGESLSIGRVVDESTKTIGPDMHQTIYEVEGSSGVQKVYKLEMDPYNEYFKVATSLSNGKLAGHQTTTGMANTFYTGGNPVVGAINGDFYDIPSGIPIGMMIMDGEIVATSSNWHAIGFNKSDYTVIGTPEFDISFSADSMATEKVKINHVNKNRSVSDLILYTPKYAENTRTNEYGTEVVLKVLSGRPEAGKTMTAEVVEIIDEKGSAALRDGFVVLSGHGEKRDKLRKLKVGETVSMDFKVDGQWANTVEAIGGRDILLKNGVVQEGLDNTKNPRTAIGVKSDGKIVALAVDGRQAGFSEGISLRDLAVMMKEMGVVNALNLDGGGSTTFATRQPGEEGVSLVNRPSDGKERANANGLLFISTAPSGALEKLVISPSKLRVFAGSEYSLSVKGADKYYNPAQISDTVFWATEGGVGEISSTGRFKASSSGASGKIKALSGGAAGEIPVEVVSKVDEIKLSHSSVSVDPGKKIDLNAEAYVDGKKVVVSDSSFTWTVEGDIGTVDGNGVFTAKDKSGLNGKVVATIGGVKTEVKVSVGKLPVSLEGFESGVDKWIKAGAEYNSIDLSLASKASGAPVRSGNSSMKISYDFTGKPGTSGVYAKAKSYIDIPEYPTKVGMWVYGDGKGHWLRSQFRDGNNEPFTVDFTTSSPGVDWTGWKYVEAKIPEGKVAPIKLDLIVRYMETSTSKKGAGAIYIDDITAIYGNIVVDPGEEPEKPVEDKSVFKDLKGNWSEEYVMKLYEMGVVSGSIDGSGARRYYPESNITRQEFAKLIVASQNIDIVSNSSFKFADDSYIDEWAKPYVYAAYEAGIIEGYVDEDGNKRFNPKANISRAEIVTIIGRSLKQDSSYPVDFADKDSIPEWAAPYVALSVEKGIVNGYDDKTFRPGNSAQRSEVAKMIYFSIK
ncbi:cellulosome-anchoring protein precursor [Andreesenia angusta]|uniref:Cellulosome-anchoring protein n=1 Tax=Andreesenia angusta TaxID=39480 RepID=A0A1S1VCJ0_9FIRM|nr:phosphodiester glycosidase family protein [Andreesenia angusta]OHW63509.1 cellulosome-anchoring protein precursor [Andreesenia angusta]